MGSFRRGIRFFRSQEVNIESRPSFFTKKRYPGYRNYLFNQLFLLTSFFINPFRGLAQGLVSTGSIVVSLISFYFPSQWKATRKII